MVFLYEASRLMSLPGLARLEGEPMCDMQTWLATANFAPALSGATVELQGLESQFLLRAFAGDINRVAMAGSESLRNIVDIANMPKSLGWHYVKMYYAALFYAHALLRLWGKSPSYLRTSDLLRVRQTISAYGITLPKNLKLQSGQYILQASMRDSVLKIAGANGGSGSHESIWREFNNSLQEFKARVSIAAYTSADKKKLDDILKAATSLLTNGGANSAWPSQMRNDIQYRQAEGLWYPYKGRNRSSDLANLAIDLINHDVNASDLANTSGENLKRFGAACSFTIAFAREVLSDLASTAGPKSFLRFGQAKFERSLSA